MGHRSPTSAVGLLCLTFLMAAITSVGWLFLPVHLLMGSPTDCHMQEGGIFVYLAHGLHASGIYEMTTQVPVT